MMYLCVAYQSILYDGAQLDEFDDYFYFSTTIIIVTSTTTMTMAITVLPIHPSIHPSFYLSIDDGRYCTVTFLAFF